MQIWSRQVSEGPKKEAPGSLGSSKVVKPVRFGKLGFVAFFLRTWLTCGHVCEQRNLVLLFCLAFFGRGCVAASGNRGVGSCTESCLFFLSSQWSEIRISFPLSCQDTSVCWTSDFWRMRVSRRIMHDALLAGRLIVPLLISGAEPGKLLSFYRRKFFRCRIIL